MKKFLYTDIDGVLCLGSEWTPKQTPWGLMYRFNKKAVEIYNYILEKTGAEIIVTSDWKNDHDLEELGEIFEWQGVIKKPIGVTSSTKYTNIFFIDRDRCREILKHVEEHKPDRWVAIDDMPLHEWWTGDYIYDKISKEDPHFVYMPRWYEGIKQTSKKEELIKKLI